MPVPFAEATSARPAFASARFRPLTTSDCVSVAFTAYEICVVPTFTAIDDATPVGHVPFMPVDVACVAACVTLTVYEPERVPSAAEINVTFGFVDVPPCANIDATPVGFALYALRNVVRLNEKLPSLSAEMPTSPGLTRPVPLTASSSAPARLFASWRVVRSPVSGWAVFESVSYDVIEPMVRCSLLAASTRACTLSASPPASRAVVTVTVPVVVPSSVSETPGSRPDTTFEPDVTWKAPGPVPTVTCASAAAFTLTSPPTPAPNSEPATLRSCSTPVVADVSCRRHWFTPTCTALATTPVDAPLMAFTTVCRLPSPVLTFVAVSAPVRSPPENVALIVPVGALTATVCPGVMPEKVCTAPPSTCTLPSMPVSDDPSVVSFSAVSDEPPVTWRVAV